MTKKPSLNTEEFAELFLWEPIRIAKKYRKSRNIISRITIGKEEFALLTLEQLALMRDDNTKVVNMLKECITTEEQDEDGFKVKYDVVDEIRLKKVIEKLMR